MTLGSHLSVRSGAANEPAVPSGMHSGTEREAAKPGSHLPDRSAPTSAALPLPCTLGAASPLSGAPHPEK